MRSAGGNGRGNIKKRAASLVIKRMPHANSHILEAPAPNVIDVPNVELLREE